MIDFDNPSAEDLAEIADVQARVAAEQAARDEAKAAQEAEREAAAAAQEAERAAAAEARKTERRIRFSAIPAHENGTAMLKAKLNEVLAELRDTV